MSTYWLYLFLLLWGFCEASVQDREPTEAQKKIETYYPKMAPNSKFLNPYIDNAMNLQFAMAAFEDDAQTLEDNKSKASKTLPKLSDNWDSEASSRQPKSLDDRKVISFLNSLFSKNKDYKFKKAWKL